MSEELELSKEYETIRHANDQQTEEIKEYLYNQLNLIWRYLSDLSETLTNTNIIKPVPDPNQYKLGQFKCRICNKSRQMSQKSKTSILRCKYCMGE